jgi:acyl-CoA reductase-like NAD-dependent aldehyde dehydrogenase
MEELYIDGEWVESASTSSIEVVSPIDGEQLGVVPDANADDVDSAVEATVAAERELQEMTAFERAAILESATEYLKDHEDEIAEQISREEGKLLQQAREETQFVIESAEDYIAEAIRMFGDVVPSQHRDRFAYTTRVPYGPCAVISPWNFPLEVPQGNIFAAIATGNPVTLKPSPETPLVAYRFAEAFDQSNLPEGAFNLVTGGAETGEQLVSHPDIRLIGFTGSVETGKKVQKAAAENNARCHLELGGKDPILVLDDANVDHAVESILVGSYANAGQVCCGTERVIATESVYEEVVEKLTSGTADLTVGNPLDEETDVGPMISDRIQEKVRDHLEDARSKGATVTTGGERDGLYHEPTVLKDVTEDMKIATDETFGPVTPVLEAEDYKDAIEIANRSKYGLQAAVFTESLQLAHDAADRLKAGGVMINETDNYWERMLPFGGMNGSGNDARVLGRWHLEAMTQNKSVMINYNLEAFESKAHY